MQIELFSVPLCLALGVLLHSHTQIPYIKFNRNAIHFYIGTTSVQIVNYIGACLMCTLLTPQHPNYKPLVYLLIFSRLYYAFFVHGNYIYRIRNVYFDNTTLQYVLFAFILVFLLLQTVTVLIPLAILPKSTSYADYTRTKVDSLGKQFSAHLPLTLTFLDTMYSAVADAFILTRVYWSKVRKKIDYNRITRFSLFNGMSIIISTIPFWCPLTAVEATAFGLLCNQFVCALMFDFLALDLPRFRENLANFV